jgi:hypothetical protein
MVASGQRAAGGSVAAEILYKLRAPRHLAGRRQKRGRLAAP